MRISNKTAHAFYICVAAVMLAGCGESQSVPDASTAMHGLDHSVAAHGDSVSYKVLFNFGGTSGSVPEGGLISMNGFLYGAAYGGTRRADYGTIFVVDSDGLEKVLYSFKGGNDGAHPASALSKLNGALYGTTEDGGEGGCSGGGCGTIFSLTTAGIERVIYSFQGGSDGAYPMTKLLSLNGTLYGTTYGGGYSSGGGTVFSVTTSGKERVLYRFQGARDGADPLAGLTLRNGLLYGTTKYGGGLGCSGAGCGTIFSVTTSGKERVLYRFQGGGDGAYPNATLTKLHGLLFGTTTTTVFSVTTTGNERVLYSFKGGRDGLYPDAPHLTNLNGVLYGTTSEGGLGRCGIRYFPKGCGTVFSVTTAGKEDVLYRFKGGNEGSDPNSLFALDGTFYGTTGAGGQHSQGTVFALTP